MGHEVIHNMLLNELCLHTSSKFDASCRNLLVSYKPENQSHTTQSQVVCIWDWNSVDTNLFSIAKRFQSFISSFSPLLTSVNSSSICVWRNGSVEKTTSPKVCLTL